MKKMIFVWIAISLIFTGCNFQNDVIPEVVNKTVNVVVNMDKPGFGDVTRAPRSGWENGDEVIVNLGSPVFCLKLIYNEGRWITEPWVDEEFDGGTFTKADADIFEEILASYLYEDEDEYELTDVVAAYFSSGVKEISFGPLTRAVRQGINIETNASDEVMGECILTCEDGVGLIKRTDVGYELTLDITMVPRVAQFTIRDLELADLYGDDVVRHIVNYGPVNMCSGGSLPGDGTIILNNWSDSDRESQGAVAYQNADGISFYAVPWSSNDDIPEYIRNWDEENLGIDFDINTDYYKTIDYIIEFALPNANDWTRNFGPKTVKVGDAVIMDGPYTHGAEGWE